MNACFVCSSIFSNGNMTRCKRQCTYIHSVNEINNEMCLSLLALPLETIYWQFYSISNGIFLVGISQNVARIDRKSVTIGGK